jgi:hypothetical protein
MILGLLLFWTAIAVETEGITTLRKLIYFLLFRFVKQHYKKRWIVLFLNLLVLKTISTIPFLYYSLLLKIEKRLIESIPVKSCLAVVGNKSIDVIIPTLVANSIYMLFCKI